MKEGLTLDEKEIRRRDGFIYRLYVLTEPKDRNQQLENPYENAQ
jgi:hypothetical protein